MDSGRVSAPPALHQSFRNRTAAREVMLHELLLALLGYTGDLIIDEREHKESLRVNLSPDAPLADEPTFKLTPDLSFIEPSDREVIERVITLGFYYRELERFASKSRNLSWIRSSNETPLSRAVLDSYSNGLCLYILDMLCLEK